MAQPYHMLKKKKFTNSLKKPNDKVKLKRTPLLIHMEVVGPVALMFLIPIQLGCLFYSMMKLFLIFKIVKFILENEIIIWLIHFSGQAFVSC